LVVNDILRVLYAPQKAFKEIIQKPRYLGPLVVLIIFVVAQVGASYVVASKSYIEQTMPIGDQGDLWTQNAALWQANSGVTVSNNTDDYINGTYYGSTSIEFAASNDSSVWMELNNLDGSVDCGVDGFKNVSLRVKISAPNVKPESVALYLYSLNASNLYFYYDLTNAFSNGTVNVWNNITTSSFDSGDWSSSSADAKWENITSLKIDFTWSSNSSIDLRIDGLFFRGIFKDPLEVYGSSVFISAALNAVTPFLFQWLLLTGLMYVIIKGLKGNVTWKPLMVAVGFALVAVVIEAIMLFISYTALFPGTNYPLEYLAGIPGESNVAAQLIINKWSSVSLVDGIVRIVAYVWTAVLGGIVTRDITVTAEMPGFGWLKSLLVSAASFALTFLIVTQFLGIVI
jgi:hypothetical protein